MARYSDFQLYAEGLQALKRVTPLEPKTILPDWKVEALIEINPNLLVSWYLILSYAYYILDQTIVSDYLYDRICKDLLAALEAFELDHRHMHLCDIGELEAGTAYRLKREDYPGMARSSAEGFIYRGVKLP